MRLITFMENNFSSLKKGSKTGTGFSRPFAMIGVFLFLLLGLADLRAQETVVDIFNLPAARSCVANDLHVDSATLEFDLCGPEECVGTIEYPLTLALINDTGSERTSFVFYARLEQYDSDDNLVATFFVTGCKMPVPPGSRSELTFEDESLTVLDENGDPTDYTGIPYLCGGSLQLINLYIAWTDASDNENRQCDNLDSSKIAPKCEVYPSIEIKTPISVSLVAKSDVSCYGLDDGAIDITVNGGTEPYSYVWTMDGNPGFSSFSEDLVDLEPGTYNVEVTDAEGCKDEKTGIIIGEPDPVEAGTGSDDSYCISDTGLASVDLAALLSGEDSGGVWTDEEDDVVNSPINLSAFAAGEYTFTYTVTLQGNSECFDSSEVTITIYDDVEAGTGSDDSYCITDAGLASVDLAALVSGEDGGGVWTDEEDDVVSSPINLSAFSAGEYTFTYTVSPEAGSDCLADHTEVTITIYDDVEAGTGSDDSYCITDAGLASVDLAALVTGEDGGGVWTDEEDDVVSSPINLSAFAAGEYTFTYTVSPEAGSDCLADHTEVTITIYDDAEAGTGSDDSYCITDAGLASVDLAALVSGEDGGGVWTNEEDDVVSSPINLSAFSAGEYTFTYTVSPEAGSDCLADYTEVTITIYDDVDAGTGSDDSYCITDAGLASVDLAALVTGEDGGGVWTDEEDDIVSSPINLSAFAAGEYTFTYTVSPAEESDCPEDFTSVTITIYDDAEAGTGSDDSYCITDAGLASVDLAALVTGEDGGGVWTNEEDDVVSSPINLSAFSAGEYTFTYTVSPEAGSDCLADQTEVTITIYDDVDAGTGSDDSYCITDSGLASVDLAALVSGEDGGGVWTDEEDDIVSSPINLSAFAAGEYTFTYTVSPAEESDCPEDFTSVTITIYDDAEAGTGSDDSYCITDAGLASVDLAALVSGEDGGGVWTDEEDDVVSSPINLSAFSAGEYTFTYTVSPEAGSDCLADHTEVTITIYDDVEAGTGSDDSYCITDAGLASVDLAALVSGEDGGGVWTDEEDDIVSSPINLSAFAAGEYTFTYTVSPEAGSDCLADHTEVTITIYDDVEAGTGSNDSYCFGDSGLVSVDLAALVSGEDGGGVWTDEQGDVVSSPINLSAFAAGEYTFTYTVSPGAGADCLADDTEVTITIIPLPEIPEIETQLADCLGGDGSFVFLGNPQNLYISFDDGDSFELYDGAITLPVGIHNFIIKYGEDGCISGPGEVEIKQPGATNLPLNPTITQPDCETLRGNVVIRVGINTNIDTDFFTYRISSGETVFYNEKQTTDGFDLPPGTYVIFGVSDNGCDSGRTEITLLEPECIVFEGCTLGYWKNHTNRWCDAYQTCTEYGEVFGTELNPVPDELAGLTLLEVLNLGGGGIYNLGRQSVAALLNACSGDVDYELQTTDDVIAYVNANFNNAGSAGSYLDELNNAGCTMGGSRATTAPSEGCDPVDSGNGNNGNNGKPGKKDDSSVSKADFSAYPVPFKETLNIKYEFDYQSQATIEFFDMRGQLLRTVKEAKAFKGKVTTVNIDFSMRANQMYVIKVTTDRETFVKQIISGR